jgi:uncharacterized protein (DUF2235 family)
MKRLIVCCDGTWNSLEMVCPTNVVRFSEACKPIAADGTPQILYYDQGIGTEGGFKDKVFGGAFGWGINKNIQDVYRFLCLNYVEGDEVYLFGFSRGAYTVRSLAGMIYCSGLLPRHSIRDTIAAYQLYRTDHIKPHSEAAKAFRETHRSRQIDITLIGCWDTVGALGIPNIVTTLPQRRYQFHDTQLNRKIQHALHAIAIDEHRRPFDVAHMDLSEGATTQIREAWFPGNHGCVGGGTASTQPLSNATLLWMIEQIHELGLGLEFDNTWLSQLTTDYTIPIPDNMSFYRIMGAINRTITGEVEMLHPGVKERYHAVSTYRPKGLSGSPFKEYLEALVPQVGP